jgi:hypothetical protein
MGSGHIAAWSELALRAKTGLPRRKTAPLFAVVSDGEWVGWAVYDFWLRVPIQRSGTDRALHLRKRLLASGHVAGLARLARTGHGFPDNIHRL